MVKTALSLIERDNGPILDDFPLEDPLSSREVESLVCPVSFDSGDMDTASNSPSELLLSDLLKMEQWHRLFLENGGQSIISRGVDELISSVTLIDAIFEGQLPDDEVGVKRLADDIRLLVSDLHDYMTESALAFPGGSSAEAIEEWFWNDTKMADIFHQLRESCVRTKVPALCTLGFLVVPVVWQKKIYF